MSQDTRKDKRAKVVSLNVRYKSATVDEFIENHSHDVSKGGIFVKTPTPFPPGTLLKFEIRLAGDKSVISGVGRVVWKREPTQAGSDKPAGMGVKFIKIDDASRAVIDKLIAQKADAGSAYTSDPAALEEEKPAAGGNPTTLRGIAVAPPTSDMSFAPVPVASVAPAPPAPSRAPAPAAPVGSTGAATRPPPAAAPGVGMASPQKTIPLGASPLAGLPRPSPAAPSVAPKPATTGGPPPPMAIKPTTSIGVGPTARPAVSSLAPQPTATSAAPAPPPPPPPSPIAPGSLAPRPGGIPAPTPPPAHRPPPVNPRKATMMGVALPATGSAPGAFTGFAPVREPSPSPAEPRASVPGPGEMPTPMVELIPMPPGGIGEQTVTSGPSPAATSASAGPMFPKMEESRRDMDSVPEPTVMKQAAELLEEALREAGGSLEEIGQNPLFSASSQRNQAVQESVPDSQAQSGDTLMMTTPFAPKASSKPPPSVQPASTASPSSVTPSPAAVIPSAAKSAPPPPLKPVGASIVKPEKKGSGGLVAALFLLAVVIGGGGYAFKTGMIGGGGATPSTTGSTPALPSATPTEAKPAAIADAAAAVATEDASALAVGVDARAAVKDPMIDASVAAVTPTVVTPPPAPKPKPRPKPIPTATATATATSTADPSDMPTSEKPDKPVPPEKPAPPPTADPE